MRKNLNAKCEHKFFVKCEQVLVSSMTSQTVNLANLGFRYVNISKVKNPGKCHDLQRKCKLFLSGSG